MFWMPWNFKEELKWKKKMFQNEFTHENDAFSIFQQNLWIEFLKNELNE